MSLRKRFIRIAALLTAAGITFISVGVAAVLPVHAEETTGYWKLKETNVTPDPDEIGDEGYASYYYSASELMHSERVSIPTTKYHGGGSASFEVTCTAPPEIIKPGDKVYMHLNISMTKSGNHMLHSGYGAVEFGHPNETRDTLQYNVGDRFTSVSESENNVYIDTFHNPPEVTSNEVWYEVTEKGRKGEDSEIAILFTSGAGLTLWIYDWVDTTPAAVVEEESEPVLEDDFDDSANVSEEAEEVEEEEPEPEEEPYIEQDVYNEAITDSGDDEGSDIIPTIIIGAGGALVAGGAAVAAGNSGKKSDNEEEKKKRFKMFVSKDFGDTIRKGASPVAVRARIDEITGDGTRIPRDDLTEDIRLSGDGIEIRSVGMNGSWIEALIFAEENSTEDNGTITFTYSSKFGSFRNHVKFRLAGKPYLRFPEYASGGQSWVLNAESYVDMLAGDNKTYPVMFYFEDAISEPTVLNIDKDEDIEASSRPADRMHTYYADLVNHTPAPEDGALAFPDVKNKTVHIYAEFENGDSCEGDINIRIYPEGLFVKTSADRMEDGRLILDAYETEIFYGDDVAPTPRFIPTRLYVMLAVPTDDGVKVLDADEAGVKFGEFIGEEGPGAGLAEKLEYDLSNVGSEYSLVSKKAIVEADDPFYMKLPVSCDYRGKTYEKELPVRVIGAKPEPLQDWELELKKVLYALKRYVKDDERTLYWIEILRAHKDNGHYSATTLRMIWWSIYYEYYDYEIAIGAGHNFDAEVFDWMLSGTEWVKWICGVCFSYAADAYTGNPVAGAVVQMAYEFVMDSIEELTDCAINGRTFKVENLHSFKHFADAGDNIAGSYLKAGLEDSLKHGLDIQSAKESLMYIGAYFGFVIAKNIVDQYVNEDTIDIPGAIFSAFKDLTTTMFKIVASELFGKWLSSRQFQTEAGKIVAEATKKVFEQYRSLRPVDPALLAGKFIEEAVGGGVGHLVDWAKGKYKTTEFNITPEGHVEIIFRLWEAQGRDPICCAIDLNRALTYSGEVALAFSPFMVLYNLVFGNPICPKSPVSFPEDPKKVRLNRMRERIKPLKLDQQTDQ